MARSKRQHRGRSPAQQIVDVSNLERALELRGKGLTYEAIGREMGTGKRTAQRRVERAIARRLQEPAEHVLRLELDRLDRMLEGLTRKGAFDGDAKAVLAAVRLMERRAKLLGLDAPEKHEHSGALSVGPTILIPAERPDDATDAAPGGLAPEPGPPN